MRPRRGQRWLVLGLARSGCAAAALLARHGVTVVGGDDATRDELAGRWERHGLDPGDVLAECRCGPGWWRDLSPPDGVVVSPGVPTDHPALRSLPAGTPVLGEVELAARFCAAPVIGITGTNGKTTTTELTAHLLRAAGYDAVALGNTGRPFADAADGLGPGQVVVLELSSFQLETVRELAPRVGVVLNLAPDHLDRYPDLAAYHAAKRRLTEVLPGDGWLVTATDCAARDWPAPRRLLFGDPERGAAVYLRDGALWRRPPAATSAEEVAGVDGLRLAGAPALANACAAVAAVTPWDLAADVLAEGLRSFRPLAHRQEVVARRDGITWVNDSKATNVHAVCAGLAGYREGVVLILGGSGKGEDYAPLRSALGPVAAVVLIGAEADRLEAALRDAVPCERAGDLDDAVRRARRLVPPGGTVLLSPACASFDMFRDYAHRGEAFRAAVARLLDGEGTT